MRRPIIVAATAVLLLASTATSADAKTVPAAAWAPKFCAAISSFQEQLNRDGANATDVLSGDITSLHEAKATLADFMRNAVGDTETAIAALQGAGAPDTPNGAKVAAAFVKALQTARDLFAAAKLKAQRLPTKTLGAFERATQKITADLNRGSKAISTGFADIKSLDTSKELSAALRAEPACASLQGS